MVGTATEVGPGQATPPRRVVLLTESSGLAALLVHLLDGIGHLHRFGSLRQALEHDGLSDADTVVLDLPRDGADTAVAHVRHHWKGKLVVLADRGHHRHEVTLQPAWTQLTRPFSVQALAEALGLPAFGRLGTAAGSAAVDSPAAPAPPAASGETERAERSTIAWLALASAADIRVAVQRARSSAQAAGDRVAAATPVERAVSGLGAFVEAWRSRRRVRVAGVSLFAVVAFAVAFALASQDRCGPGCGAFGTGYSPLPTVTPGVSGGPVTTAPRRVPATTATPEARGPRGTGAFGGISSRQPATPSTGRPATTTTRDPGAGGGAPGPTTPPTRPPTTPTTAPPTTPTTPTTPPTTTVVPQEP